MIITIVELYQDELNSYSGAKGGPNQNIAQVRWTFISYKDSLLGLKLYMAEHENWATDIIRITGYTVLEQVLTLKW